MLDGNTLPTPGDYLRRELQQRGLAQRDLAFILGVPDAAINQVLTGKRGVSAEMAKALALVFDVSPEYVLGLQKSAEMSVELARAREPDPSVARKARLIGTYPIREMIKRGWVDADAKTLEVEVTRFFGVRDMNEIPHLAHAGKKSDYGSVPPAQLAWLFRVKQVASEMVVPRFNAAALREALPRLHALTSAPEEARHVPRILSECGIRFVIVESLPSAKIDGVCFWLDHGRSPVVGMSLRFDRLDNFWFVLRHELEHVLNRDGVAEIAIDSDLEGEDSSSSEQLPEAEQKANAAASDFCVPRAEMDSWIARKHPFYSEKDLLGFARRIQVHPGIVAGQLRNRTRNYKVFSKYLEKVRFAVAPAAVVDGWGQVAPTSIQEHQ